MLTLIQGPEGSELWIFDALDIAKEISLLDRKAKNQRNLFTSIELLHRKGPRPLFKSTFTRLLFKPTFTCLNTFVLDGRFKISETLLSFGAKSWKYIYNPVPIIVDYLRISSYIFSAIYAYLRA